MPPDAEFGRAEFGRVLLKSLAYFFLNFGRGLLCSGRIENVKVSR